MERVNINNICEKHQEKKDYIFCLERECRNRLCCEKCHFEDSLHKGHKSIKLRNFMKSEESELGRIFN